jgi:hypothetical protein
MTDDAWCEQGVGATTVRQWRWWRRMVVGLPTSTCLWESDPLSLLGQARRTSIHEPLIGTAAGAHYPQI